MNMVVLLVLVLCFKQSFRSHLPKYLYNFVFLSIVFICFLNTTFSKVQIKTSEFKIVGTNFTARGWRSGDLKHRLLKPKLCLVYCGRQVPKLS